MSEKIKIKLGQFEVEYEGTDVFIQKDLSKLVESLIKLIDDKKEILSAGGGADSDAAGKRKKNTGKLTTSSISARLKVSTGPDLVLAALTKLVIVDQRNTASRKEITSEMRSATEYFNIGYAKNLTGALSTLVKSGVINKASATEYSLSSEKLAEMENIFG